MNESTIPRIKSHLDSGNGFAIISAHVHEYIKKAIKIVSEGGSSRIVEKIISSGEKNNKNRHNQLKEDVRSLGYGYIEVDGNYTYEAIKIPNVNLIIDNFNVEEESLIVPTGSGILSIEYVMKFREDIISLGKKYWMNYGKITINTKTGKQKKLTKLAEFLEFKGKDPGLANPCIRTNRDNGESHDG